MKKTIILSLCATICATAFAQLSVRPNGQVTVGTIQDSAFVKNDSISDLHIYGMKHASDARLRLGLCNGTGIGTTGFQDRAIEISGETGFYLKVGGFTDVPLAYYDDYSDGSNFIFNTDVESTGFYQTSDKRMKKDIKDLGNTLSEVKQLKGVSYKYINDGSIKSLARADGHTRFGVIAQDVEKVYPELVTTDNEGYKRVDYIGLIPVLLNAVNELQDKISYLETELQMSATQGDKQNTSAQSSAKLYQNSPNPFTSATEIKYELPQGTTDAAIYVFDIQGSPVKQFELTESGEGSVTISSSELKAGIYAYTLMVNGKEVDNKRMILSK